MLTILLFIPRKKILRWLKDDDTDIASGSSCLNIHRRFMQLSRKDNTVTHNKGKQESNAHQPGSSKQWRSSRPLEPMLTSLLLLGFLVPWRRRQGLSLDLTELLILPLGHGLEDPFI